MLRKQVDDNLEPERKEEQVNNLLIICILEIPVAIYVWWGY
jgi:hypothetical protein